MGPWRIPCVALALLAAQAGATWAAEDLAVEVQGKGAGFAVRAGATVAAPLSLVWEVLTDYENLPRFIPGIAKSGVRVRKGNRALLEQRGEARFLVFSFPVQVELDVRENPQTSIVSRAVGGNLRRLNGRYDLHVDAGNVSLRYTGEIEPDFGLPAVINSFVVRSMVEAQFSALVAEIERRAAASK